MSCCLITGASGFLGRHLCDLLPEIRPAGEQRIAIGRTDPGHPAIHKFHPADLLDRHRVRDLIASTRPATVFHLAGRTPPGQPEEYYRDNLLATVSLLDALRDAGSPSRVILVGSAAELGPVPVESLPVGEDHPARPAEPYGLSKWLAAAAGLAMAPPLEVVVARVFNLIGPGMSTSQALGRFAAELARGPGPVRLAVGDLEARRDFIDARDVAGALASLASRGTPGRVYHVGTGRSRRVGDGLDRLIELSGRAVSVEVDSDRGRSRGPVDSRADIGRIAAETGWSPRIGWDESLRDLWDDALRRAGRGRD